MCPKEAPLRAAIDIGSNTVLLLVAREENGHIKTIYEEQRAPRLGKNVDTDQNLHPDSMQKAIAALKDYRAILINDFPEVKEVYVAATSAVRDAANRSHFIEQVKEETRFKIQLLSGQEEAEYTFAGATSVFKNIGGECCVLDIGGGSTEVAVGKDDGISDRHSYNIGSVRFTERFLRESPPTNVQIEDCRSAIHKALNERPIEFADDCSLIGVAGTVTSLAHMDAGLQTYQPETVNGKRLKLETINAWVEELRRKTSEELLADFPEILEGRADVFLGGLLILQAFMENHTLSEIIVSTGGIRHGAIVLNM